MPISIDSALGIHQEALRIRARRAELLASNIANADTPNYKARDIDFKAALGQARDALSQPDRTHARHLSVGGGRPAGGETLFRVPTQPSLDGNTVDLQAEQAAFAQNSVQYQASLQFLGSKFKGLLTAIRGE